MKKITMLVCALSFIFVLTACGISTPKSTKKLNVVTTFYPLYDFTKNVSGGLAQVTMLIPSGTEAHDYEPSAKDMAKIEAADVFIYHSDDMETWVPQVLKNVDRTKTLVICASEGIQRLTSADVSQQYDPHVWLSPPLARKEVKNITDGLKQADKKKASSYQKQAQIYLAKLKTLDSQFRDGLKGARNRTFITQHAAFQYLAKTYHLQQIAITGLSPDEEPSPKRLTQLQQLIKTKHAKVIYFEDTASPKVARMLAKATGAHLEVLSPIEGITAKAQHQGKNYLSYMRCNLEALKRSVN